MGRYFLALDLTEQAKSAVSKGLLNYRSSQITVAKWVRPVNYHITLLYLGEQPRATLKDIEAMAGEVAFSQASFNYDPDNWGFFPNFSRAKVMFIGVGQGREPITSVARQLSSGAAELLKDSPERFHPHLTVARFRQPVSAVPPPNLAPIKVSALEIILYSSELTPSGPNYKVVDKFCFSGIARGE